MTRTGGTGRARDASAGAAAALSLLVALTPPQTPLGEHAKQGEQGKGGCQVAPHSSLFMPRRWAQTPAHTSRPPSPPPARAAPPSPHGRKRLRGGSCGPAPPVSSSWQLPKGLGVENLPLLLRPGNPRQSPRPPNAIKPTWSAASRLHRVTGQGSPAWYSGRKPATPQPSSVSASHS